MPAYHFSSSWLETTYFKYGFSIYVLIDCMLELHVVETIACQTIFMQCKRMYGST